MRSFWRRGNGNSINNNNTTNNSSSGNDIELESGSVRMEEPFFMHPREESRVHCIEMANGLVISLLILSLQFRGQYFDPPVVQLPWIFSMTDFTGSNPGDYFEPLYMFVIGFNVQVSVKKFYRRTLTLWANMFIRGFLLLTTGVLVNLIVADFHWSQFRFMGFFQRVLILWIIMIVFHLYFSKKIQCFVVFLLFISYLGIVMTVQNEACPNQGTIDLSSPQCNGICSLDMSLLTQNHMQYQYYDRDGVFSLPNVLFIAYVGYSFARQLTHLAISNLKRMLMLWLIGSVILVIIGLLSSLIQQFIPPIYMTNFVLLAAGIAGIVIILLFLGFDILNRQYPLSLVIFSPLKWVGKNGLFLYGARMMLEAVFVSQGVTKTIVDSFGSSEQLNGFIYNFLFYILFVLIAFGLQKININVRF